jgi:prephenate dehydrogenase
VTLVGLGLMAGSLALRLKQDRICRRVTALVRREEAVREALDVGAVDWAGTDPAEALAEADVVIFATPVRVLLRQIQDYRSFYKPGAVITDLGSTKRAVMAAFERLPAHVYPIGSHPMCGKEVTGLSAADASLYNGATWVVSPLAETPEAVIYLIETLATQVGAKPLMLDPAQHDLLVAAISHLPYLLSVALVRAAQTVAEEDERVWQVAASGFRDTSRLAASDVNMMMDILLTNGDAVVDMLARLRLQLDGLAEALAAGDEDRLRRLLEQAQSQRRSLYR